MKIFLISYEPDKPGQDSTRLIDRLEAIGAIRVVYSEWVVRGDYDAKTLQDDLQKYVEVHDQLLVVVLTGETAWNSMMIRNEVPKKR